MRSNAAPLTFEVGDNGKTVSCADAIEDRDGETVLIGGRTVAYPGSEVEARTQVAQIAANMYCSKFILL